jgi:uncharacterized protein (DUF2141 family)
MKNSKLTISLLVVGLLIIFSSFTSPQSGRLVVTFDNIEKHEGYVEVSLFNEQKKFLKKGGAWQKKRVKVSPDKPIRVVFENVPFGTYAAAGYHDVNGNAKFDRNLVGLPKEPYVFSRKFRKKIRKPRFKEVHFNFEDSPFELEVELQKF